MTSFGYKSDNNKILFILCAWHTVGGGKLTSGFTVGCPVSRARHDHLIPSHKNRFSVIVMNRYCL